jgi:Zn-dependent protease
MNFDFVWILKSIPAAIMGLTFHEFAHAFAADRLGDNTARLDGRLTLNPAKRIDVVGFILIVVAGFGWAKPVSFNPANLKKRNRDEILISLAGPFSNLLLGVAFIVVARLLFFIPFFNSTNNGVGAINTIILWGIINFGLFIFNLLPIPPLDGSHVYLTYFKEISETVTANIYRIGTWGLLLLVLFQNRSGIELIPVSKMSSALTDLVVAALRFN